MAERIFYKTASGEVIGTIDDQHTVRIRGVDLSQPISYEHCCKTIVEADFLVKKDGSKPTWEEIFNSSPSGELFHVHTWYWQALCLIQERKIDGSKIDPAG